MNVHDLLSGKSKQQTWIVAAALLLGLIVLPFLIEAGFGKSWLRIVDFALLPERAQARHQHQGIGIGGLGTFQQKLGAGEIIGIQRLGK